MASQGPSLSSPATSLRCDEPKQTGPCGNDSKNSIDVRRCTRYALTVHRQNYNVCSHCHTRAEIDRTAQLNRNRQVRWVPHCKSHSEGIRRRDPTNLPACTCMVDINDGWACEDCSNLKYQACVGRGNHLMTILGRTHRVRNKKTGQWERKSGAIRKRAPCPFNLGRNRCAKVPFYEFGWKHPHPNATYQCLNCEGIILQK